MWSVIEVASALRAARARLGLTQEQAAELLATSQANVSAYERSRLQPGRLVSERIEALATLTTMSIYGTYLASTLPSTAAAIRRDLSVGQPESVTLRLIIQASDDFARLTLEEDRRFFLSEPSPTGSRRWDALLAGLAVHLCRRAGMDRTPWWTTDPSRTLDDMWWFGRAAVVPRMRAHALQSSIASMRSRGIAFSRRNLESV